MAGMATINLAGPIESLKVIQTPTFVIDMPEEASGDYEQDALAGLERQKQQYAEVIKTLETAAAKMHTVYEKMIVEHRQAIAKLAVEIARKILAQKVKDGDYQIETIIQEALNNSPTRQDVVIRLNPQDLNRCQQMQQQGEAAVAGVKFIADPGIGPAQCVIETPKGKVESLIEEHLVQVDRALCKAV